MTTGGQPRQDWTVVLRRRPARIVRGRMAGGRTGEFEIVCRECGDDPDLDFREISPQLQRIRGPYRIATGVTAYLQQPGGIPSRTGVTGRRRAKEMP